MAFINGTPFNDNNTVNGDNTLHPQLNGTELADTINGLAGSDILLGNGGNDILNGGLGIDTINGGAGIDRVIVEAVGSNITLTNNSVTGEGTDTLSGIQTAELSVFQSNNVPGNINASAFTLGSVTLDGGSGSNILRGGSRNDFLDGEGSNDTLTGGSGNDILDGGSGDDLLTGGSGFDRFHFNTGQSFDRDDLGLDKINDFSIGSDKIVLDKTTFNTLASPAGGTLSPSEFEVVDSTSDLFTSNAKITYNFVSGDLVYNRNGSVFVGGEGEGGFIADLKPGNGPAPLITTADFSIVA